jgi:hypothetical protein
LFIAHYVPLMLQAWRFNTHTSTTLKREGLPFHWVSTNVAIIRQRVPLQIAVEKRYRVEGSIVFL